MGKIVDLHVHKNTIKTKQRKLARRQLTRTAQYVSRHTTVDGFALVTFSITEQGGVKHQVHYDVPSPSFAYVLPQMAQQALHAAIIDKEPEDEN